MPDVSTADHRRYENQLVVYGHINHDIQYTITGDVQITSGDLTIDNLAVALKYYEEYEDDIADRLTRGREQISIDMGYLKRRSGQVQQYGAAVRHGKMVLTDSIRVKRIQEVEQTWDSLWELVKECFPDQIRALARSANVSHNFKPADPSDANLLRHLASTQGIPERPDGYSAADIFQALLPEIIARSESSAKVTELGAKLEMTQEQLREVKLDLKETRSQLSTAQNDKFKAQLSAAKADPHELRKVSKQLEKKTTEYAQLQRVYSDTCEQLEAQKQHLQSVATTPNTQAAEIAQRLETVLVELEASQERQKDLQERVNDSQTEARKMKLTLDEARVTIVELNGKILDLSNDKVALQGEVSRMENELDIKEVELGADIGVLTMQAEGLQLSATQTADLKARLKGDVEDRKKARLLEIQATQQRFEGLFVKFLLESTDSSSRRSRYVWTMQDLSVFHHKLTALEGLQLESILPGRQDKGQEDRADFCHRYEPIDSIASLQQSTLAGLFVARIQEYDLFDLDPEQQRRRLFWLEHTVVTAYVSPNLGRSQAMPMDKWQPLDNVKLGLLIWYLVRMLTISANHSKHYSGLNFAWASCLLTKVLLLYKMPVQFETELKALLRRPAADCNLLQAAGMLRLKMVLRLQEQAVRRSTPEPLDDVNSNTERETLYEEQVTAPFNPPQIVLDDTTSDDVLRFDDYERFDRSRTEDNALCTLNMPEFLRDTTRRNLIGSGPQQPWFVYQSNQPGPTERTRPKPVYKHVVCAVSDRTPDGNAVFTWLGTYQPARGTPPADGFHWTLVPESGHLDRLLSDSTAAGGGLDEPEGVACWRKGDQTYDFDFYKDIDIWKLLSAFDRENVVRQVIEQGVVEREQFQAQRDAAEDQVERRKKRRETIVERLKSMVNL